MARSDDMSEINSALVIEGRVGWAIVVRQFLNFI